MNELVLNWCRYRNTWSLDDVLTVVWILKKKMNKNCSCSYWPTDWFVGFTFPHCRHDYTVTWYLLTWARYWIMFVYMCQSQFVRHYCDNIVNNDVELGKFCVRVWVEKNLSCYKSRFYRKCCMSRWCLWWNQWRSLVVGLQKHKWSKMRQYSRLERNGSNFDYTDTWDWHLRNTPSTPHRLILRPFQQQPIHSILRYTFYL